MSKLWIEDSETIPATAYQDTSPAGSWTDYSNNIIKWDCYGLEVLQFMHARRHISTLIAVKTAMFTNWNALTSEEKDIACKWVAAPYALRMLVVSDSDDRDNYINLIRKLRGVPFTEYEGREHIIELMRERVADQKRVETWGDTELNAFYYDTASHIDAFTFANTKDLIQWITNEVGSDYENAGFADESYYDATLKTDLEDIYNAYY